MCSCLFEDITEMDKADKALDRQEVAEEVIEALHLEDEPVLTMSSELDLDLEPHTTCRSNEQPTLFHGVNEDYEELCNHYKSKMINQAEQVEEQLTAIKDNYEKRHDMIVIDSMNSSENDANNDMEDVSSVEEQLGPGQGQSDDQSVETDKILFADTLLKYLDKRTERGKTNYKWDGKPDQLKDFTTLILKRDRQWKPKKVSGGKQMYTFTNGSEYRTLNFWQSSNTVSTQGNEKNKEKVQEKLDHLLQAMKPTLVESEIHTRDNQWRTKQNEDDTVTKPSAISNSKKKKNTTETEIQNLWQSVNDLKNLVKKCSINSPQNSNNTNITETSVLQTGVNQLESEKGKLENEREHARILNMELIKLINNQHDQIHQHSKAELEQVKPLNLI